MDVIVVVLPAFIIFAIGFIGQKAIGFDRKTISKAALYLMYPFLAFQTFYNNPITLDFLYIILFCVSLMTLLILLVKIVTSIGNMPGPKASAMVLSSVFMNSGNYGVPIILFAYGESGVTYAIIMMVIQSLLMNTVGLYYASKGSADGDANIRESLKKVMKMPINHAVLLGIVTQLFPITIPSFIMQAVNLVADATIPTIMIVLGMQLATLSKGAVQIRDLVTIGSIKMIVSPILAFLITSLLGLSTLLSSILIVLAAMPTAANTTMYSIQYNTEPQLVSYSTFWTTLLSIVTIPLLLWMVGAV
ncbi:AEC family transporter [Pontibacillus yanchengensis]|uniref:Membrane protein n=1 Tax=Pontibacillus yanchengensis Y32 TaxID=1385514 RepID=A0A0A2TG02_9BACI|nr:AEC family transporter [Pontibacillus yanchengensis]KGP74479.1 membrane protein [Pontibacillus yanchengensis Y32]